MGRLSNLINILYLKKAYISFTLYRLSSSSVISGGEGVIFHLLPQHTHITFVHNIFVCKCCSFTINPQPTSALSLERLISIKFYIYLISFTALEFSHFIIYLVLCHVSGVCSEHPYYRIPDFGKPSVFFCLYCDDFVFV